VYSGVKHGTVEKRRLLIDSLDSVFRPGNVEKSSMELEFPHLFSEENIHNTFYIDDGTTPVSQASVLLSKVNINGAVMDVASLGSVSTLKEHRHKGLSTRIINEIIRVYTESKIDLLLVSGEIELYTKLNCVKTGRVYTGIARDLPGCNGYTVKEINSGERIKNCKNYQQIYRKEKFRFLRTEKDFKTLLDSVWFKRFGFRMELFEIKNAREELVAYVVAFNKTGNKELIVMEYAGSRRAISSSLGKIAEMMECNTIRLKINGDDIEFLDICSSMDIELKEGNSQGTLRVLNSKSIFQKLEPLIREKSGSAFNINKVSEERAPVSSGDMDKNITRYGELTHFIFDYNGLGLPLMFTDDLNYI
jgi:hypothetical protein